MMFLLIGGRVGLPGLSLLRWKHEIHSEVRVVLLCEVDSLSGKLAYLAKLRLKNL